MRPRSFAAGLLAAFAALSGLAFLDPSRLIGPEYRSIIVGGGAYVTGAVDTRISLGLLSTAYVQRVTRLGYAARGDGPAVDYIASTAACTISGGDGGSQVPSADGKCWVAILGTSADARIWGVQATSSGVAGSGADDTVALQSCLAWGQAQGARCLIPSLPAGRYTRTTAPLLIKTHVELSGAYVTPYNGPIPSPGAGSWLHVDHAGRGIVVGDTTPNKSASGVVLRDFGVIRNQPAPVSTGTWAAAANDFDVVQLNDDLRIENVMLLNPTKAVSVLGGRTTIDGLRGQFLQMGLQVDGSLDVVRAFRVHDWPFWSQAAPVLNYQRGNKIAIDTKRADGFRMSDYYSLPGKNCWHIGTNANGDTTYAPSADNLSCDDFAGSGLLVDGSPTAPSVVYMTNFGFGASHGTGYSTGSTGAALDVKNNTNVIVHGFTSANTGGPAVSSSGRVTISGWQVQGWNLANTAGVPAFSAAAGSSIYLYGLPQFIGVIPTSPVLYGPTGTVMLDGVDPRLVNVSYTPTVSAATGALGAASATGTYTKRGTTVTATIKVSISNNGSGGTALQVTLPFAPVVETTFTAFSDANKAVIVGYAGAGNSTVSLNTSGANGYPGANGASFTLTATYQTAS